MSRTRLPHCLLLATGLISLSFASGMSSAQAQQVCSIKTEPNSSFNLAIYKFSRICPTHTRRGCDRANNGSWRCSSEIVDSNTSEQSGNSVSVSGYAIVLPADGWYQIQDATNLRTMMQGFGGKKYFVPNGTYHVINLTKNIRTDFLEVPLKRSLPTMLTPVSPTAFTGSASPPPPQLQSAQSHSNVSTHNSYASPPKSPLKIFPGAEGFGTNSVGGRGGRICKVTNLNNSGNGSFRQCAESSGPRIVVFETGGTIEVDSSIIVDDPFISVYGQTAPGDGILLRSNLETTEGPLHIKTHDVLIQHLRLRAGISRHPNCCRDALLISNKKSGSVYNVVVDHNSISWGTDQISHTWYDANNITYSNNLITESMYDNDSNSKGPAGRGLLIGSGGAHSISVHNNLFAHSYQRNPMVKTSGIVDVTNNLIYHWVSRGGQQISDFKGQKVNWVKNHYITRLQQPGKSTTGWGDILLRKTNYPMEAYFKGNIGHNRPNDNLPEWKIAITDYNTPYNPSLGYHSTRRFPAPPITEVDALELQNTLPPHVGASAPRRDSVDTRILREFANQGGKMPNCVSQNDLPGDPRCLNNVGGWPNMATGVAATDSDNDGIADSWEIQHGLNPRIDDSRLDHNNDGYLNIEDYAFDLTQR